MEGCGRRLRDDPSYKALQEHYQTVGSKIHMRKLFEEDEKRFEKFSLSLATSDGELLLDYSKNIVTEETMKLLFDLVGVLCSILSPFCCIFSCVQYAAIIFTGYNIED
ncbi:Glucose-6-phosphate isomerase [Paramuricea clavata]|uniref:Glucose-6-phosphate isomerase n=1 Tax=Paramuricea clavata TaxID=317549 RepID=A0A6S7GK68_PARCT|nr:Glucose-6-phosphate isomerase [Paramuricea clavata]